MSSRLGPWVRIVALSAIAGVSAVGPLSAQEPQSAGLAKELTARLADAKLEAVAAKGEGADQFVAALWIPEYQLLVVSARYSAPAIMTDKVAKKQYRDVYLDLNAAAIAGSRLFVEDLSADGVKVRGGRNDPYDSYESGNRRVAFDGDYRAQKITEDEYQKAFAAAEEAYANMLSVLLAALKKGS